MNHQIAGISIFIFNITCEDVIPQIHHTAVNTANEVGVFLPFVFHADGVADSFPITLSQCSSQGKLIGQLGSLAVIKGDRIPISAFHEKYRGIQTIIAEGCTGHGFNIDTDMLIVDFQIAKHHSTLFFQILYGVASVLLGVEISR